MIFSYGTPSLPEPFHVDLRYAFRAMLLFFAHVEANYKAMVFVVQTEAPSSLYSSVPHKGLTERNTVISAFEFTGKCSSPTSIASVDEGLRFRGNLR